MATKDDRPGLLSKVAKFVRNPTKDWSELDQQSDTDANGYDKQALKAMIERKRQNDFVRKREFDQLRKLRNRDPGAMANIGRHSFFQTSLPNDVEGRADTLKKIDEIEAQMSRQWWKSKNDGGIQPSAIHGSANPTKPPLDLSQSDLIPSNSMLSAPFPPTEPVNLQQVDGADFADEFLPTQMASGMLPLSGAEQPDDLVVANGANDRLSTSRLIAIEGDAVETDPELEEAAIRFANSDDAGAEKGLLAALRSHSSGEGLAQAWAEALLDLYRATNSRSAFEAAIHEFAPQLDGARPVWFALVEQAAGKLPLAAGANGASDTRIWDCPARLMAQDLDRLRRAMESRPMPWHLGWRGLESITADAIPLLGALFGSLCEEVVSLRFEGEDRLVRALRAVTPSGHREVARSVWDVRLNALRAMGLQDDFELASLDYCVTYGATPPTWTLARCKMELSSSYPGGRLPMDPDAVTQPGWLEPGRPSGTVALVLQGQMMGDTAQSLSALDTAGQTGSHLVISCRDLIRVDFAAAGSILNWVTMRHAEGKQVQFQDVQRLVAAFFEVIGINERATVILRTI